MKDSIGGAQVDGFAPHRRSTFPPVHLADTQRFLRKLTARRVWNATKVGASYYATRLTRKPIQWGQPITISVEPTTACNLRCPECPSGLRQFTRPTGNLKQDFFRETIEQLGRDLVYLIFYFQGEPYINPAFLDMVRHAHERGVYTITSTNGHFLSEANAERTVASGLDRVIISVDGTDQETYQAYRKEGKLANVLQGARNLVAARERAGVAHPHIIFQFLVVRPNEHQIPEIYRLAEEVGVDEVKLKTAQVYDFERGNPLIPTQERYSRYARQPDGTYRIKNQLLDHCWKLWHSCVITWDGLVVPCCFDKDAEHRLGDLKRASFREIWHSRAYKRFRRSILGGRENIEICRNCTEGCRVWETADV